ncbi:ribonuclease H-like domain-containing protein [Tanacetum coccineum]
MQKYILKQQFEGFSVSNSEGLHKGYDMFQSLLSHLEIHGAGVSTEDANQKFIRPNLSASIAIKQGTLLESANQKEIKKAEEEMHGTLDIKQKTIGGDLENRRNLKLCQMSAKNKYGLGYGNQIHQGVLSYGNEVFQSVFDSRSSDVEDSPVHDRFENVEAACSPRQFVETLEYVLEPVVVKPKVVSQPKVWSDAPIIEEYESDNDDEYVIQPSKEQEKPSFAFVNTVKHVKTPRETVKEQNTYSPSPKADKRDWNGLMSKRLDCDFLRKKAKHVELNKKKGKGTGQEENRPMWNNVQRLNHQNKFVPKSVLTKTGIFLVNTARQNLSSQAATTSTARKVNTARPIVNEIRPRNNFYKSHSPIRRPFNRTTAPKANFSNQKVNTAEVKAVSAIGGKRKLLLSPQQFVIGDPKDITGTKSPNTIVDQALDYNGGPVAFRGSKGYITGKDIDKKTRFSWVFFLRTKDETSGILKDFIRQIENQLNQKVKTIRCDNGTEFKNMDIIELCGSKGIKREYSNARTPQQNRVVERKNRTLIKAARIMLADSFLPNTFWAKAVSTACYVLNRVLVTKPQNKTPYELITGKIPIISYIRPFGCHVTILNTIDHLGKFEEKSDEGFLVGYSLNSKAFRVYNLKTKRVEENLHINFLENKPNIAWKGPNWLFDLDYLTDSMNYQPITAENKANKTAGPKEANHSAGTQDNIDARNSEMEVEPAQEYFVLPLWSSYTSTVKSSEEKNGDEKPNGDIGLKTNKEPKDQEDQAFLEELERLKRQ